MVPLLRAHDAHLNALALLLTSRSVDGDKLSRRGDCLLCCNFVCVCASVAAGARVLLEDRDVAVRYMEVCAIIQEAEDAAIDADTKSSRAPQDAIAARAEAARVLSAIAFEVVGSVREDLLPTTLRHVTRHCGIAVEEGSHSEPLAGEVRTQLLKEIFASLFLSEDASTMPSRRRLFLASECIALESHIAACSLSHHHHDDEEACGEGELDNDAGDDDRNGGAGGSGGDDHGCGNGRDDGEGSVCVGSSKRADVSRCSRAGLDFYDEAKNSSADTKMIPILSRL